MPESSSIDIPSPTLLVFLSSASLMTVELVGGRIMAEHLGGSLYCWTSVVGSALAGVTLGGVLGGQMADRKPAGELLWLLFCLSSLLTLAILPLEMFVGAQGLFNQMKRPLRVLIGAPVLLLPAAISLACIPPVAAKVAIARAPLKGRTVGRLYAFGSLGSIVGTLLTGFLLVSLMGTRSLLCVVAALLGVVCLFLGDRLSSAFLGAWSASALGLAAILYQGTILAGDDFTRESNYYRIRVSLDEEETLKTLYLDNLAHSIIHPGQPDTLAYEYEQIFALLTERAFQGASAQTLTMGAGGYAFPRYLVHLHPNWEVHVVEIDPLVTRVAHQQLGLPEDTPILTFHSDARRFLAEMDPEQKYDLIYGDAFNSFSIPWHLTTKQFHDILKTHLDPQGVYLANVIDLYRSAKFLGAYVNTLKASFPHVRVFSTQEVGEESGRDTFIVAASLAPFPLEGLLEETSQKATPLFLLEERHVEEAIRRAGSILLTDSFAPVDQCMAAMLWADNATD